MDGAAFGALVASRSTPASLQDAVRPSHMATLRRCWNSERPRPKAQQPKPSEPRADGSRRVGGSRVETRINGMRQRPEADVSSPQDARAHQGYSEASDTLPRRAPADHQRSNFAPPPRGRQAPHAAPAATASNALAYTANAASPVATRSNDDSPNRPPTELSGGDDRSPDARQPRAMPERQPGECHDKAIRPTQVPRLDLSALHAKEAHQGQAQKLGTQQWMKPNRHPWNETGPQYQTSHVSTTMPAPRGEEAPQGFSCASCEDQQRIAEFYGYRDEGFIATMHDLKTDCIRPRLYLGTMADAAYWPLLQSVGITHILNVAIEAQRAQPPYDAQGIMYMLLPWQDTTEQAHALTRQKFRQLREATRFIDRSLKATFQVKGKEKKASVLVHCVQGLNRSAAIVCAYLMEYEGVSLDRALSEVRGKHLGCLSSRHWQDFLHKFNADLLRGI